MKHFHFGARIAGLLLLGSALLAPQPARAQAGAGMPDLSDFAGAIASTARSAPVVAAAKADKPNAVFSTGLSVPRVKPGSGAAEVGKTFREAGVKAGGPEAALKELEAAMPKYLVAIEGEMTKNKVAPRDMGVAVAVSLMQLHKDATKSELPEKADDVATKTLALATAKVWGPNFKKLPAAQQENLYEKLMMSAFLNALLIAQFDAAGKTEDADAMRQASGELFETLVGVPASSMKVSDDGVISGLAPDKK